MNAAVNLFPFPFSSFYESYTSHCTLQPTDDDLPRPAVLYVLSRLATNPHPNDIKQSTSPALSVIRSAAVIDSWRCSTQHLVSALGVVVARVSPTLNSNQ